MRARQCGDVVGCDKQRCMGHHDWVGKEVDETGQMRWVGRDTMDKTGTHQWPSTDDALPVELLFLETCPPYILAPPLAHRFSESSSHRKHMP